jgi:hypothetical protein
MLKELFKIKRDSSLDGLSAGDPCGRKKKKPRKTPPLTIQTEAGSAYTIISNLIISKVAFQMRTYQQKHMPQVYLA